MVQIWSRGGHVPLRIEGNETLEAHRVDSVKGGGAASREILQAPPRAGNYLLVALSMY